MFSPNTWYYDCLILFTFWQALVVYRILKQKIIEKEQWYIKIAFTVLSCHPMCIYILTIFNYMLMCQFAIKSSTLLIEQWCFSTDQCSLFIFSSHIGVFSWTTVQKSQPDLYSCDSHCIVCDLMSNSSNVI